MKEDKNQSQYHSSLSIFNCRQAHSIYGTQSKRSFIYQGKLVLREGIMINIRSQYSPTKMMTIYLNHYMVESNLIIQPSRFWDVKN
ncbi:unnamed protein product [Paramecium primaurelia]|uniref:Uncharacterized protein n=1 Tax=Paramecium primaurelia TaxID=5886 RepID=A0A8S1MDB3_PARPR|nr:unnamed protein product [Paramecium primaurelia]